MKTDHLLELLLAGIIVGIIAMVVNAVMACAHYRASVPKSPLIEQGCRAGQYVSPDSNCYK